MSKKQFEESLNYGDCNNLFFFFNNILSETSEKIAKSIDLIVKKD